MTKFVIIAIVAVALCSESFALNPFDGITRLKNEVKSASNDLSRYGNNIVSKTRTKLMNLKFDQMQNVNTAVNNALAQIRTDVSQANSDGKNAEHCYESGRQQLGDASKTVFSKLDKCVDDQLTPLTPVKNNIDSHVTQGSLLLSQLDSITIKCGSAGGVMQVQLCVAQNMPTASSSVNAYKATATQLKSTGDSISNSAPASIIGCFQPPMTDLYSATAAAKIATTQCIRNA